MINYPKIDKLLDTKVRIISKFIEEAGTSYFVILPRGADAPNSAQVKAGTNANDVLVQESFRGSVTHNPRQAGILDGFGLSMNTEYDFYVVAEDVVQNLQSAPKLLQGTTTAIGILEYPADTLPQNSTPAWTKTASGTYSESVSNGILYASSVGNNANRLSYTKSVNFINANGGWGEMRCKTGINNEVSGFQMHNVGGYFQIIIYPTYVRFNGASVLDYDIDTTKYHIYRIEFSGGTVVKGYIDNVLIFTTTTKPLVGYDNRIYFGGDTDTSVMEMYVDYVRWRDDSYVYVPGLIDPPIVFTSYPNIINITGSTAEVNIKSSKDGIGYCVALIKDSDAPTVQQVIDGEDATGTPLAPNFVSTTSVVGSQNAYMDITGLSGGVDYDVYVAVVDIDNYPCEQALKATFTTKNPITGLVTSLKFDNSVVTERVPDSTFDWSSVNSPTYTTIGTRKAISLNGSDQYLVSSDTDDAYFSADFSIIWKGRFKSLASIQYIYCQSPADYQYRCVVYIQSGYVTIKFRNGASLIERNSAYSFSIDTIYTVGVTISNNFWWEISVNGQIIDSFLVNWTRINLSSPIYIGCSSESAALNTFAQTETLDFMMIKNNILPISVIRGFHNSDEPFQNTLIGDYSLTKLNFDNDTVQEEVTTSNFDFTAINSPTYVSVGDRRAVRLNGSTQWLQSNDTIDATFYRDFTIAIKLKFQGLPPSGFIDPIYSQTKTDDAIYATRLYLFNWSGNMKLSFYFRSNINGNPPGQISGNYDFTPTLDTVYTIALTLDSDNNWVASVNGTKVGELLSTAWDRYNIPGPIYWGRYAGGAATTQYSQIDIIDTLIKDYALSLTELTALHNSNNPW